MPSPEPRDRSEILHRILEQEVRRGYDDGTVIGGLEQFLANWQAESGPESAKHSQSLIAIRQVLEDYHSIEPADRSNARTERPADSQRPNSAQFYWAWQSATKEVEYIPCKGLRK